jgi:tetratricopeptide (TPR) repeat protein
MSLLNEALRKKDRELEQIKKVNLFRGKPKPRNRGMKRFSVIVIFIVLSSGLAVLGVWYGFLSADPPAEELQLVNTHIFTEEKVFYESARPQKPQRIPLKDEPKAPPIIASTMERKDQKIDKNTSEKKETSKGHHIKTTKPTKKETLITNEESNKDQSQNAQKVVDTPAPSSRRTENLFFKKAVSYHRQNKLEMAIQMYLEVLAGNPEHPDALLNLSSAYIQSSSFSKACPLLKKLRGSDPENSQVLLNFAIVEIGLGRPNEAIDYLKRLEGLSEEPQFEIYFHRGVALSHLHELGEALTWYKKAEKLSDDNPLLLFNMAVAYDKLERYDEALRYYVALLNNAGAPLSVDEKKKVEDRMGVLKMFVARQESSRQRSILTRKGITQPKGM